MYIIRDPINLSAVAYTGISQILAARMSQLKVPETEVLSDIGEFIIVEPGDTIANLEEASGCAITTDLFGEAHYGDPDFVPNHEWLEHHQDEHCFEMVFIMTDDGYFTVLLIPDDPGIDPDLLSLCWEYS